MIQQPQSLVNKMQRKTKQTQRRVEKLMVKAANSKSIPILYNEIQTVIQNKDVTAASAILPCATTLPGEPLELAFVYLDMEDMNGLAPGFYLVRVHLGMDGIFREKGELVDLDGHYCHPVRFVTEDCHVPIIGEKPVPVTKNPVLDAWNKRGETLSLEGSFSDGAPFVIILEF